MKIIAHRGLHAHYKQNTKEALCEALEKEYIDGIEFDIRMTKDKKLVIIHSPIISTSSIRFGIVKNMTYRKLLKYNIGTIAEIILALIICAAILGLIYASTNKYYINKKF